MQRIGNLAATSVAAIGATPAPAPSHEVTRERQLEILRQATTRLLYSIASDVTNGAKLDHPAFTLLTREDLQAELDRRDAESEDILKSDMEPHAFSGDNMHCTCDKCGLVLDHAMHAAPSAIARAAARIGADDGPTREDVPEPWTADELLEHAGLLLRASLADQGDDISATTKAVLSEAASAAASASAAMEVPRQLERIAQELARSGEARVNLQRLRAIELTRDKLLESLASLPNATKGGAEQAGMLWRSQVIDALHALDVIKLAEQFR